MGAFSLNTNFVFRVKVSLREAQSTSAGKIVYHLENQLGASVEFNKVHTVIMANLLAFVSIYAMTGSGTGADPYMISTYADLESVGTRNYRLSDTFQLANDIDASASKTENLSGSVYQGFVMIGTDTTPFTGSFHGAGHVIRNLTRS